jgi:putative Mg2+ transporter-C (MgtC) family protein
MPASAAALPVTRRLPRGAQRLAMDWIDQLLVVATTGYAMLLGGVVGFERELKDRPAGFRTHMLVAGAASLLLGMGQLWLEQAPSGSNGLRVTIDPLRLIEAVIAGVSFIGAGTIFSSGRNHHVAGITTAASLLMVAVIGVAAGLRYHVLAFAATALTLLVLAALDVLERRLAVAKSNRDTSERP